MDVAGDPRRSCGDPAGWIAIDGPAAAGKTTAARLVAERLGYLYVDTGAMYRALTLKVLKVGMPLRSGSLRPLLAATSVSLVTNAGFTPRVFLDGCDVTAAIRCREVTARVSQVSAVPEVREAMVRLQRRIACRHAVVMEGRDVGTVVLPQAKTKVFLTAARRERARRRLKDFLRSGHEATFLGQYLALMRRDRLDSRRAHSPLKMSPDAVLIDTTLLAPDNVADCIVSLHQRGGGGLVPWTRT
jgi:cytidylate kinase